METPETIAESYINGNLSWVKEQCKSSPDVIGKVYQALEEIHASHAGNFIRWVAMW